MVFRVSSILFLFLLFVSFEAMAQTNAPESPEPEETSAEPSTEENWLSLPPVGEGSAQDEIRRAKNLYDYGSHQKVVDRLERAFELQLFADNELRREALALIGVSAFILGDETRAGRYFLDRLRLDPDFRLNPVLYPPAIIDFVERIRQENQEELDAIQAQTGEPQPPQATTEVIEKKPYYVNFIPFGAGQFQNDQDVKGALFLSSEVITLSINVTAYFVARSMEGPDGKYSSNNATQARDWTIVQYSALGACFLIAMGGIIDAALNWQPEKRVELLPETNNSVSKTQTNTPVFRFEGTGASLRF